jgi:hypothetical protein
MSWNEIVSKENKEQSGEKMEYLKLENGVTQIRIVDEEPVSRWRHWIPQTNSGKGTSVNCIGKGCPVCAEMAAAKKTGTKQKYSSTKSHAINVISRADGKIKVLDKGNKIFSQLATYMQQMGDLRGYDIKIVTTNAGNTDATYTIMPVFPPTPLTDAEKALPTYDLLGIMKPLTAEQILQLMNGKSMADITAVAEETTPADGASNAPNVNFGAAIE